MDRFNIGEPRKVLVVEREDALYPMDSHRRNEPGVMNLNAGDVMRDQDLTHVS